MHKIPGREDLIRVLGQKVNSNGQEPLIRFLKSYNFELSGLSGQLNLKLVVEQTLNILLVSRRTQIDGMRGLEPCLEILEILL